MEELEVPTESLQETITEEAEHQNNQEKSRWISWVALSSALLAVLAAITALLAGHHSNEAVIDQIQASDSWAHYQAKAIKAAILSSKIEIIKSMGHPVLSEDTEKSAAYKRDQEEISERAREKEEASKKHFAHHMIFARGLTLYQIAIAIAAISVLTRRPHFWWLGLGFGGVGTFFLIQGLV
jgi:hypothetical protein